jgi:hypothetical protein
MFYQRNGNLIKRKTTLGSQAQEIYYSEDKASNKTETLTYPYAPIISCTLTYNLT